MIIRPEKQNDTAEIRYLNEQAFGRPVEAQLGPCAAMPGSRSMRRNSNWCESL